MSVEYFDGGKHARFAGKLYTRDNKTGYYLNATSCKRLHRAVYEAAHGPIPKGLQVHHIDGNKANNEPENLIALTTMEHRRVHWETMPDERREWFKKNINERARPAAIAWHKSPAGRALARRLYEQNKDKLHRIATFRCENCGKEFETMDTGTNRFCSNACKSAYRRKSGVDDVTHVCPVCGKEFRASKFVQRQCCSRGCANRYRRQK